MDERSILYVTSRWGEPTQTFVRREALAVAAVEGTKVSAVSIKRPAPSDADRVVPCAHLTPVQVAGHALRATARNPRLVSRILWSVLRNARARNVPPLLAAVLTGIAWADARLVNRSDRVHVHFGWVSAAAAWAATRVAGAEYSVVLHAFELHRSTLIDDFSPIPLAAASTVFTISERDRSIVAERWRVPATVLRMGVPRSWLDDEGRAPREPDLIVAVGSLVRKKGHHVLLEALARTDAPWRLVIVGEGPARLELTRQIQHLGLADRVSLAGRLPEDEVRNLLHRAAVACLACVESEDGDRDGIPVALMEAMACGAPVISTTVGAIPELVDGAGLLVPPGDVDALATAIDSLAGEAARTALARAARQRIAHGGWVVEDAAPAVVGQAVR